jgi:hypothetical protein
MYHGNSLGIKKRYWLGLTHLKPSVEWVGLHGSR